MTLLADVRFALRLLWKDRWFTAAAVTALALGLGVNATVFTFVNAVLLRGLPFPDSARILYVDSQNPVANQDRMGASDADLRDWRQGATAFEGLGAWNGAPMNLSEEGRLPERFAGCRVSANTFALLRMRPILGRDFTAEDERPGAPPVLMLGHAAWRDRYGADPGVIGRVVRVNEVPATIIGVMPEGLQFPADAMVWQILTPDPEADAHRDRRRLAVFGRLAPGIAPAQAQAELAGLARAISLQHPQTNKDVTAVLRTFNDRFSGGNVRTVFLSLMGAVGFVLLIACANVANLLLSRSIRRTREVAVRMALGASRWRIMRQLLVESLLLSALGGLLGLGLAMIGVRLFDRATSDVGKPAWILFTMDWTVFLFLAAICVATGLLFGMAPAWQVSRTQVQAVLKDGARGQAGGARARRFSSVLIVLQIALTLVLLTGGGLMVRSFFTLYGQHTGVAGSSLLTMVVTLGEQRYPDVAAYGRFYERLSAQLANIPGAAAVTFATNAPLDGAMGRTLEIEGQRGAAKADRPPTVSSVLVGDRYLDTIGVTLRRGRDFGPRDGTPGLETAIVNERFVDRFFPGEEAIGRRIRLSDRDDKPGGWVTIIGISPTIRQRQVQELEPDAVVYRPLRFEPYRSVVILARGQGEPALLATPLREAVQTIDPDLPVFAVRTFDALLARARWPHAVFGTMFALFALIALVLSSVGIYAVMAYAVTQRRQEIGIRMALGASSGRVVLGVLRGGLIELGCGLALGLAGGFGASQVLQSLLVRMEPRDPLTFGVVVLLLVSVTLIACIVPARRAARVDPLTALRTD